MKFAYASRPTGRLIFFALLALLPVHAADITRTVVQDTILRANGSPAPGTLLISWPSFRTAHNEYVAAGSMTVPVDSTGAFSVALAPTAGSTPVNVQYRVVLQLTGSSPEVQYWVVPATSPSGIVLATTSSAGNTRPPTADPLQFILRAGDAMTGTLTLNGPPTLPDHAATKQYVDDAISPAATKTYVDTALASTATKSYVDDAVAPAATKSYVDSAISSAASKAYVDSAIASVRTAPNVKDFGATCDGAASHDDTSSFQNALNSFAGKGGTLRIPDGCLISAPLTFPTYDSVHRGNLTLALEGSLFLKATLELPANVSLIGVNGIASVQFQTGPAARLEDRVGNLDPILRLTGGNNYLENISIPWGSATGIKLDGSVNTNTGALARLHNVGVLTNGHALTINNYFWVWTRDSRFLNTGSTDSVWITNSSPTAVGMSGLIYFDDTILSGGGMRLDSQVPTPNLGSIYLNRLMRENGVGPLLTLDATNADIEIVSLDHVADADQVNVQDQVRIIAPPAAGKIYGLHIKGQPPNIGGDTTQAQIFFDGNEDTRFTDINLGTQRFWNYSVRSRVWDIENIADDFSFNAVPFTSLPVNQDPTTWVTGGGSWTQSVLAPDGSTQAATMTSTVPIADAEIYRSNMPLAVGDWIVAGVYVKGSMPGAPAQPMFSFNAGTLPAFEHGGNYFYLTPRGFYETQWRLAFGYDKVVNAGTGAPDYILSLRTDQSHSVSYAFPFVLRIPASAGISELEIQRWVRSVLRNVVSGVPAGNYALRAHHRLYFGSDTYLSRTAAGQLGVNGNPFALSSDLASKADAAATTAALATKADAAATTTALSSKADTNTLNAHVSATAAHGATGALVGTTNTQTLQNKTLDSTNSVNASAVSGNITGTSGGITGKITPTGALVGTTDTQSLQNKTLDATNSVAAAAVTGNIGGNAAGFTGSLAGDVTGSQSTTTVAKVNGVAYSSSPSTDTVPIITASNTSTYKSVPNCADTTGNHLNYSTSTHGFSCGTSSSVNLPSVNDWSTGAAISSANIITVPSQNTTRLWALFVPVTVNNPTKLSYYLVTADNTANLYDVGLYNSSGTLLCHTGALAGTSFAASTGAKNASFLAGCGSMSPGRYYFGLTTNCSSSCATMAQIYSTSSTGVITALSAATPASGSSTTGGALNASVGIPADSWSAAQMPAIFLHQ